MRSENIWNENEEWIRKKAHRFTNEKLQDKAPLQILPPTTGEKSKLRMKNYNQKKVEIVSEKISHDSPFLNKRRKLEKEYMAEFSKKVYTEENVENFDETLRTLAYNLTAWTKTVLRK